MWTEFCCRTCGKPIGRIHSARDLSKVANSLYCSACCAEDAEIELEEDAKIEQKQKDEAKADYLKAKKEDYFEDRHKELHGHAQESELEGE